MVDRRFLLVIAVSVLARLASALYQGNVIQPLPGVTDQISYHELAIRVMNGHGFSFATGWWPITRANEPTAHWSFLYAIYLTAVYSVVGVAPLAARVLQATLVGVLQPWLTWRIGSRLFGAPAGLLAAAGSAVYGYFAFYGGALVTEPFYIVAFLAVVDVATAMAAAAREGRAPGAREWGLLGLLLAVTVLLRQAFVLVVPVLVLWLAWELQRARNVAPRRLLGGLVLAGVVAAACILPWTARNYRAFGQFVLLNTNAGYVFYYGSHPMHGTEFVPLLQGGPSQYQSLLPRELRRLNEAALDRALLVRGLGFVRDDPARYLRLSASRAKEYFKFWPSAGSGAASNLLRVLSFGLFLPLFLAGAVLAIGRSGQGREMAGSGALLLLSLAALYTLVHLLTWTLVRYRLPIDALAMPFAGVALSAAAVWLREFTAAPARLLRRTVG